MKKVTNEEYNLALKNEHYIKIGKSILRKFKFDNDLRKECWLIGLWDAMRYYDDNKKIKFTTYLYYRILWLAIKKSKKPAKTMDLNENHQVEFATDINEVLELIPDKYRNVVYHKYIDNMTIGEIGKKYTLSPQTIANYLKIGLDYLKSEKNGV